MYMIGYSLYPIPTITKLQRFHTGHKPYKWGLAAKLFDTRSYVLERNYIKVVYITSLLFIRAALPNWRDIHLEKNCTNVDTVVTF